MFYDGMRGRRRTWLAPLLLLAAGPGTLLAQSGSAPHGVLLLDVAAGGPAAGAGLARGSEILEVAGVAVHDSRTLVAVLQDNAGQTVDLNYRYGPDLHSVRVRLGDGRDTPLLGVVPEGGARAAIRGGGAAPLRGVEIQPERLRGALVLEVQEESAAARAGIEAGDIIQSIDRQPVASADGEDSLGAIIAGYRPGARVEIEIDRAGDLRTLSVTLGQHPQRASPLLGVEYRPLVADVLRPEAADGESSPEELKRFFGDREGLRERLRERLFEDGALPLPRRFQLRPFGGVLTPEIAI
jgi:hypothetical protein